MQLNDLSPSTIVNTIRRHKVTHVFAVPLFWEKVFGLPVDLGALRLLLGRLLRDVLVLGHVVSPLPVRASVCPVRGRVGI